MDLTLHPERRTVPLAPGRPVLESALAARVRLPFSCRGGSCGACRARLLAGQVAYPRGRPLGLSDADVGAGIALLCQAVAQTDLVVELDQVRPAGEAEVKTLPCRVERIEALAPDVRAVFLRLPAIEEFRFEAGQYLDVLLPGGLRRSFSIASPPHDAAPIELHVRRVPGGAFSERVFRALAPGALLQVQGPLGHFVYREPDGAAGPLLLVAGGTGFAPIKSILRHLLERGLTRPVHLYVGARHEADLYAHDWIGGQCAAQPRLRYVPVLSMASAAEAARHRTGLVHEALLADFASLADAEVYAAGPPPMVAALRATLPARGLPAGHLHVDAFEYAPR
ncbi:MAG: 2Fe-2S iron-sulfur cluster binding domain-containing protein [Proteobacteria bacterium]|nr:2Fe-2S iron-sulfur cluster binding domain-containing protein [Pseudomonadota bacterium]